MAKWNKKREEYNEVWNKIKNVVNQREQNCRKAPAGSIIMSWAKISNSGKGIKILYEREERLSTVKNNDFERIESR